MLVITIDGARNIQQAEHLIDGQYFWMGYACHILHLAVWEDKAMIAGKADFIGKPKSLLPI